MIMCNIFNLKMQYFTLFNVNVIFTALFIFYTLGDASI